MGEWHKAESLIIPDALARKINNGHPEKSKVSAGKEAIRKVMKLRLSTSSALKLMMLLKRSILRLRISRFIEILIFWMTERKKLWCVGLGWIQAGKRGRSVELLRSWGSRGVVYHGLRKGR